MCSSDVYGPSTSIRRTCVERLRDISQCRTSTAMPLPHVSSWHGYSIVSPQFGAPQELVPCLAHPRRPEPVGSPHSLLVIKWTLAAGCRQSIALHHLTSIVRHPAHAAAEEHVLLISTVRPVESAAARAQARCRRAAGCQQPDLLRRPAALQGLPPLWKLPFNRHIASRKPSLPINEQVIT